MDTHEFSSYFLTQVADQQHSEQHFTIVVKTRINVQKMHDTRYRLTRLEKIFNLSVIHHPLRSTSVQMAALAGRHVAVSQNNVYST